MFSDQTLSQFLRALLFVISSVKGGFLNVQFRKMTFNSSSTCRNKLQYVQNSKNIFHVLYPLLANQYKFQTNYFFVTCNLTDLMKNGHSLIAFIYFFFRNVIILLIVSHWVTCLVFKANEIVWPQTPITHNKFTKKWLLVANCCLI